MGVKAGLDLKTMVEALSTWLGSTRGLQNMAEMLRARKLSVPGKSSNQKASPQPVKTVFRDRLLALEMAQEIGAQMPIAHFINELDADSLYEDYTRALNEYLS